MPEDIFLFDIAINWAKVGENYILCSIRVMHIGIHFGFTFVVSHK